MASRRPHLGRRLSHGQVLEVMMCALIGPKGSSARSQHHLHFGRIYQRNPSADSVLVRIGRLYCQGEAIRGGGMTGLSETQARLLRLVSAGTTSSKALANETGLQPRSIDTYLHAAAKALGCANRILAAQRFVEIETQDSQSPSQLRTTHLAARLVSAILAVASVIRSVAFGLPVGGAKHDFGWRRIGLEILRVGIIGMVGVIALVLLVVGFLKTFS